MGKLYSDVVQKLWWAAWILFTGHKRLTISSIPTKAGGFHGGSGVRKVVIPPLIKTIKNYAVGSILVESSVFSMTSGRKGA